MPDYRNALSIGTQLDGGKYAITDVLGAGGFGVVYRARHRLLGTEHAIKEYLPSAVALREGTTVHPLNSQVAEDYRFGLESFLREARKLRRFAGHPNIAQCTDFFEGNGTAYLVMTYEDGLSLAEILSRREAEGMPLEESEIVKILLPLLEGLASVHAQNVLHRDIKPGNIFIRRRDEQPVLLDFGAAKQDFSRHSRSRGAYTEGYAPMELVGNEGHLGPWTDVYAIGALMWRMIVGEHPRKVEDRMTARLRGRLDPLLLEPSKLQTPCRGPFLRIVERCLALEEEGRFQSAGELRAALLQLEGVGLGESSRQPRQSATTGRVPTTREGATGGGWKVIRVAPVLLGLILLTGAGLGVVEWNQQRVEAERLAKDQAEQGTQEREAARQREVERLAEEARLAEDARKSEKARQEQARLDDVARQQEAARLADERRRTEDARIVEEARRAESARLAEELRVKEEEDGRNRIRNANFSFTKRDEPSSFKAQWNFGESRVLRDENSGLLWRPKDNARETDFRSALRFCQDRAMELPSIRDFRSIYDRDGATDVKCGARRCKVSRLFGLGSGLTGWTFWTNEEENLARASYFDIESGQALSALKREPNHRALCVARR